MIKQRKIFNRFKDENLDFVGINMKSSGGGTTVQNTDVPSTMKPYINKFMKENRRIYDTVTPEYFGGNPVAGLNSMQNSGISSLFNQGQNGFSFNRGADDLLNKTMNGDFLQSNPIFGQLTNEANGGMLTSNPYMDSIFKTKLNDGLNAVDSRFAMSGRTGSGYHAGAAGEAAGRVTDDVFGRVYDAERGRQQNAQGMLSNIFSGERDRQQGALGLSGTRDAANWANDLQGNNAMLQAGGIQQQQAQSEIDAAKAKFDWQQQLPFWKLQQYLSGISGVPTGQTSSTTTPGGSRTGSAFGGALTGASLGSMIPGFGGAAGATGLAALGPAGLAGGALGLLGGLF